MKRLQLTITEDTYETIRLSAKNEKRSVTNYLDILLESLFHNDVIVRSDGTSTNVSVKTQIKLNDELLKSRENFKIHEDIEKNREIERYKRVLTDEERTYFKQNPDHDLIDFKSRNDSPIIKDEERLKHFKPF